MRRKIYKKQLASLLFSPILLILGGCTTLFPAAEAPQGAIGPDQREDLSLFTVLGDAPFPAWALLETDPMVPTTRLLDGETVPVETAAEDDEEVDAAPADVALVDDELFGEADAWDRIRNGFALPDVDHPRVTREFKWFARHPEYIRRVADRARPYLYYIVEEVERRNIPMEIALLPIVESAFQPFAYSHGRAAGIWQFIPSTGRLFGLRQTWWYDGRRDIYASTQAALNLLERLHKEFKGDWMLALAAYNSGSGTVRKAVRRNRRRGRPIDFFSLKLPPETRGYVPKLLALKKLFADPQRYGIEVPSIPDEPYFAKVDLGSQIDLSLIAELADIEMEELYQLNPGFNRWATDPRGPHYVLLPKEKAEDFQVALAKVPKNQRIRWIRHRIRTGETLGTIARKYRTSVAAIKRLNRIRGTRIRAGRSLLIPTARARPGEYRLSEGERLRRLKKTRRKGNRYVHLVQRGDTLWDIAQLYGVGVRSLAKWNGMAPRDTLKPGQKLVIWTRGKVSVDTGHMAPPPQRRITKRIGYRVRPGDSLSRISSRFKVTIAQLRRWNRLPKGRYLQPGQRLTLYIDVIQQSGRS